MSVEVYLTAAAPGLTVKSVAEAIMTAPHARLVGGAITLDKARVRVAEADPGEIWVDLLNHDDEGAFVEFDSLYDHLVRSTPWDMWTGYDDVPALCKSTGIAMKHRPLLARAS